MKDRILLVDDDANVLAGYSRQLHKLFNITTAESGAAALEIIASQPPFAVVVSDMRMPNMDGVEFLSRVMRESPNAVRILLTGNADLDTSIKAINEGCIFRFLHKTCTIDELKNALADGVRQHRLVTAEQELLYETLTGAIRLLTEILSLTSPMAFSKASRIRRYVRQIAAELDTAHFWEYDMAALLSQIGQVALPPEILERLNAGRPLTREQKQIQARHPAVGRELLAKIPRLEMVAQIVFLQDHASRESITPSKDMSDERAILFGGQLLRLALEMDQLLNTGMEFIQALSELQQTYGLDHPMVEALMGFDKVKGSRVVMHVVAEELSAGAVAAEDILSTTGQVLVTKGHEITTPVVLRLRSCAQANGLKEPFAVEIRTHER